MGAGVKREGAWLQGKKSISPGRPWTAAIKIWRQTAYA